MGVEPGEHALHSQLKQFAVGHRLDVALPNLVKHTSANICSSSSGSDEVTGPALSMSVLCGCAVCGLATSSDGLSSAAAGKQVMVNRSSARLQKRDRMANT